ncbi:TetR/AcrR family transcriptional regulator [Nocardia sp. NBC_01503]|uniref:TetR/AcrR family transcriptional regulator n=1 Tax=Nocardia sp. NBC_01503 TaxID=2975997 RepID=UPI002E7B7973|nr:TetR/AcrR family transcriptional regulator [Nocardia sp. NBC_01503]WTL34584.1 TetR/AcrR family transcriptional regulator [Nocardia sp. NBC_01503]
MAPPRKHDTDVILDAARTLVLREGPRAASVAAIAEASGAPVGTLYHRFGNRNGVLTAAWLRALDRFQTGVLGAAAAQDDPIEAAVAMTAAALTFGRERLEDAKLLLNLRPRDLLDGAPDSEFNDRLAAMNEPLFATLSRIARGVYGSDGERELDAVRRAVVDLPYGALRRYAYTDGFPDWLDADLVAATRALLAT